MSSHLFLSLETPKSWYLWRLIKQVIDGGYLFQIGPCHMSTYRASDKGGLCSTVRCLVLAINTLGETEVLSPCNKRKH